jgi:hypothetical protein
MTTPQQAAYKALQIAAERIGRNGYQAEMERRKMTTAQALRWQLRNKRSIYTPTGEHCAVVEAMPKVLSGEITPEEAMGLLWQYDVMKQRGL